MVCTFGAIATAAAAFCATSVFGKDRKVTSTLALVSRKIAAICSASSKRVNRVHDPCDLTANIGQNGLGRVWHHKGHNIGFAHAKSRNILAAWVDFACNSRQLSVSAFASGADIN